MDLMLNINEKRDFMATIEDSIMKDVDNIENKLII